MAGPSRFDRRAVLGGLAALAAPWPARAAAPPRIFAAASLQGPLEAIAPDARIAYAGSGAVARQVAAGAPADLVILAAADWMDWLVARGAVGAPRVVARNALVLAGPRGAGPVALTPEAVSARLGAGRMAMGDPMAVPAGRYAQQAFETLGLWATVAPRVLAAGDARAALAWVARGAAPLGAVYRSDLALGDVEAVAAIPAAAHAPIVYPAAVAAGAAPGAAALLARIAAAGATFATYGFAPA